MKIIEIIYPKKSLFILEQAGGEEFDVMGQINAFDFMSEEVHEVSRSGGIKYMPDRMDDLYEMTRVVDKVLTL